MRGDDPAAVDDQRRLRVVLRSDRYWEHRGAQGHDEKNSLHRSSPGCGECGSIGGVMLVRFSTPTTCDPARLPHQAAPPHRMRAAIASATGFEKVSSMINISSIIDLMNGAAI